MPRARPKPWLARGRTSGPRVQQARGLASWQRTSRARPMAPAGGQLEPSATEGQRRCAYQSILKILEENIPLSVTVRGWFLLKFVALPRTRSLPPTDSRSKSRGVGRSPSPARWVALFLARPARPALAHSIAPTLGSVAPLAARPRSLARALAPSHSFPRLLAPLPLPLVLPRCLPRCLHRSLGRSLARFLAPSLACSLATSLARSLAPSLARRSRLISLPPCLSHALVPWVARALPLSLPLALQCPLASCLPRSLALSLARWPLAAPAPSFSVAVLAPVAAPLPSPSPPPQPSPSSSLSQRRPCKILETALSKYGTVLLLHSPPPLAAVAIVENPVPSAISPLVIYKRSDHPVF